MNHHGLTGSIGKADRKALWNVLKVYNVEVQLLEGSKALYREAGTHVRLEGELGESFFMVPRC